MQEQTNPLICDPIDGICGIPDSVSTNEIAVKKSVKPVTVIYFTDPICSSCWGIEPQLRTLKLEYGSSIEIEYRMGGLLPDWSYNSGGISKPSDVAHHWDEVSLHYDMPIDGDIWLEDPLASSYPPSIAFKAAQAQDKNKAILFLREIREMVFLQKRNITKWEYLEQAAQNAGLDIPAFKKDYEGRAKEWFQEDLQLAKEWGVRGFPTLFFTDSTGKMERVYGSKPYNTYEEALLKLDPHAKKNNYATDWSFIFSKYHSLTAKEFSALARIPRNESEDILNGLVREGRLNKLETKNGALWTLKESVR